MSNDEDDIDELEEIMPKRYVYFRTPTGKPHKSDDGKFAPKRLLSDIGTFAKKTTEGSISFGGFPLERFQCVLQASVIIIDPDGIPLNDHDVWTLVWNALTQELKEKCGSPVNTHALLRRADTLASEFFRKALEKYVTVTTLSLSSFPSSPITVRSCQISEARGIREKFPLPEVLTKYPVRSAYATHFQSTGYLSITVESESRSAFEAIDRAFQALNILRGLWTLILTFRSTSFTVGGHGNEPIGILLAGPVHTLHKPDGTNVDESIYWHNPHYHRDANVYAPHSWEAAEKLQKRYMSRMEFLPHKAEIEELLQRYVSALDQTDYDNTFLQLWSLLEYVTGTVGAQYEETIRRATWVFSGKSRAMASESLGTLRCHRNQYVHAGKGSESGREIASLMKWFLDPHLVYLVTNRFRVTSVEEYGQILTLPKDIAVMKRKRRRISRAILVRRKWEEESAKPATPNQCQ
jgi:hypothetical protein